MEYQHFTSLPPEQERSFVIYEQTSVESGKKAMTIGAISGVVVGILAILLFLSFDAPRNAHAVDEPETDLKEEKAAPKAAPAPAPAAPAPAEAPAAAPAAAEGDPAAAPAAADPAAAPAAAPMEAPAPPKGATKAPPTALIGQ